MKSTDFEYDGIYLSDMGYTICKFNSGGLESVSNGSQITFKTTSIMHGTKQDLASAQYDNCLECTFQICKKDCYLHYEEFEITSDELQDVMRWLNRKGFHRFKLLDDESVNIYFEGSFTIINKIKFATKIVGLELTLVTNRPFALMEEQVLKWSGNSEDWSKTLYDLSQEEGHIYPIMEITCSATGNLTIVNSIENRTTQILNCTQGEKITLNYPIIESSLSAHSDLQNDFNWNFPRIANTFNNNQNTFTFSLPCKVKMKYSPIIKVGID